MKKFRRILFFVALITLCISQVAFADSPRFVELNNGERVYINDGGYVVAKEGEGVKDLDTTEGTQYSEGDYKLIDNTTGKVIENEDDAVKDDDGTTKDITTEDDGTKKDDETVAKDKAEEAKKTEETKKTEESTGKGSNASSAADKAVSKIISSYRGTESEIPGLDPKVNWGGKDVDLPDGKSLTQDEKLAIANWGRDVQNADSGKGTNYVRTGVAFLGIVIIVYALFLYLAYWVDRVNNYVELSFLSILSFHRITLAPDETTSTFSASTSGEKMVIHKDMLFIVVIGIGIGVFLLTGTLYSVVQMFLEFVQKAVSYM